MPIMNAAFWMLVVLALAIAGVLTVLDEMLGEPTHAEPVPTQHMPRGVHESKNSERRSGGECRT